jgi:hypothetical protein
MGDAAKRRATYEDVLAAPEHVVAEVVHGVLRVATWTGDAVVRAEPFDALELELATLWAD